MLRCLLPPVQEPRQRDTFVGQLLPPRNARSDSRDLRTCVAFSMIGDFENAASRYGDRGYRYVHFEAGAIGQRMYLAAEALGLGATGIGAFFDEEVNRYLGLSSELGQVVYHFAIGYPVADPRLEA